MPRQPWQNFSVWRGRLPHWRADDVNYYVTFRHRRALEPIERQILLNALLKPEGRKWDVQIACVLPEQSDLIVTLLVPSDGRADKLAGIVEKAKVQAGKAILKRTEERFPPFYTESYDRIIRDDPERIAFLEQIVRGPVDAGLAESPEEYGGLWVREEG
jgi:REP-associated tyrosine transposase